MVSIEGNDQTQFLNKKHNRESGSSMTMSNEDRILVKRHMSLNMPLDKRSELNEQSVKTFNSHNKSFQYDYNDIALFEKEINYMSLNTYDILIIFYDFPIRDIDHFKSLINSIMSSIWNKTPFFIIRLGLMGRIQTTKGDINISITFTEMSDNEDNTLNVKLKSVFNSFMQEEDQSINQLIAQSLMMHWTSNAKCIFLLHKTTTPTTTITSNQPNDSNEELNVSSIEDKVIDIANKGIEFHCMLIDSIENDNNRRLYEQLEYVFIRASNVRNSFIFKSLEHNDKENKDGCIVQCIANASNEVMRRRLYSKDYFEDLIKKYTLDTIESITEKYNVDNSISLLTQIDQSKLSENEKKRIELITLKLPNSNYVNTPIENKEPIETNDKPILEPIMIPDFSNRNLIRTQCNVFPFDLSFAAIHKCICHSMRNTPFKSNAYTTVQYNKTESMLKISENIYLTHDDDNNKEEIYTMAAYDYYSEAKLQLTIQSQVLQGDYNLQSFLYIMSSYALCESIGTLFNLHYYKLFPHNEKSPIRFTRRFLYQMANYDSAFLFAYELPMDPSLKPNSQFLTTDIKEAFSHFSYQISGGISLITDIEDVNGVIVKQRMNKIGKEAKSYQNTIHFFLKHCCNELCQLMHLIHPISDGNEVGQSFYEQSQMRFIEDSAIVPCYICHKIYTDIIGKVYCKECIEKNKASIRKAQCESCHKKFEYSNYYYDQLGIQRPLKCNDCID